MKPQHTQSAPSQSDWDRERNEADPQRAGGPGSQYGGRPYPRSGPESYPESHQQYQAQREHPGSEYFSGGYGGRAEHGQHQAGYGAGSQSEAEQRGYREQQAYQAGGRQQGYGGEEFGRGGYGGYGREEQEQHGRFGQGQQGQYGQGEHRQTQSSQYGRGDFEERPFSQGESGRFYSGYSQASGGRGAQQHEQYQGYGGQYQGGQQGWRSQGYSGFQSGQPQDYGAQEGGQFMSRGSHQTAEQFSGGYGSYGAYQVGSQPGLGRQQLQRGPKGYARSDERIREMICEDLIHRPGIDASEVSVQVQGGRVVLEGSVPQRRMKHEIEDVADACWGVKEVDNRIRIQSGQEHESSSSAMGAGRGASPGTNIADMSSGETGTGVSAGSTSSFSTATTRKEGGMESKGKSKGQRNR